MLNFSSFLILVLKSLCDFFVVVFFFHFQFDEVSSFLLFKD